jgi:hypothetical protein
MFLGDGGPRPAGLVPIPESEAILDDDEIYIEAASGSIYRRVATMTEALPELISDAETLSLAREYYLHNPPALTTVYANLPTSEYLVTSESPHIYAEAVPLPNVITAPQVEPDTFYMADMAALRSQMRYDYPTYSSNSSTGSVVRPSLTINFPPGVYSNSGVVSNAWNPVNEAMLTSPEPSVYPSIGNTVNISPNIAGWDDPNELRVVDSKGREIGTPGSVVWEYTTLEPGWVCTIKLHVSQHTLEIQLVEPEVSEEPEEIVVQSTQIRLVRRVLET